jgi:hypothetical protein
MSKADTLGGSFDKTRNIGEHKAKFIVVHQLLPHQDWVKAW